MEYVQSRHICVGCRSESLTLQISNRCRPIFRSTSLSVACRRIDPIDIVDSTQPSRNSGVFGSDRASEFRKAIRSNPLKKRFGLAVHWSTFAYPICIKVFYTGYAVLASRRATANLNKCVFFTKPHVQHHDRLRLRGPWPAIVSPHGRTLRFITPRRKR